MWQNITYEEHIGVQTMLTTDEYYEESYGWMFRDDDFDERHFETFNDEMDYIDFRM